MSVNVELLSLYWDVGRLVAGLQTEEGWGAGVIPRLAKDIRNDLPEVKGFSVRNIGRMLSFYREYGSLEILPPPVAKFQPGSIAARFSALVPNLPWAHNVILMEIKDCEARLWYMEQTLEHGWSKDWLTAQIKADLYARQGRATTNFTLNLPAPQSVLAQEALKDPYIFDFLTLTEPFQEKELESGLVAHLEKFLLELGAGFAFVGRQYHLAVSGHDFYIDLLFYHIKLRCYVAIELKKGPFKPEYAGKANFYCSAVDDLLRAEHDQPTIGLILCQTADKVIAEYALRKMETPIGVS